MFAAVALTVSIKMLFLPENLSLVQTVPRGASGTLVPTSIGGLSSMMGIGGGTLCVPVLTLLNQPIHRAVGTAALFGLIISLPGSFGYVPGGWGDTRAPWGSLGYVNLLGFALIAPVTVRTAPLGVKLAHSLSKRQLRITFGCFLLLVACRMIYRSFT